MNASAALLDPSTSAALAAPAANGTIGGGLLRPGAIDQATFLRMLQAQQSAREAAGVGGQPVQMPVQPFQDNIPTLTPAQFAALVGGAAGGPGDGSGPAPVSSAASAVPVTQATAARDVVPLKLSGMAKPTAAPAEPAGGTQLATAATTDDQPTIYRNSAPKILETAQASSAEPSASAAAPAQMAPTQAAPTQASTQAASTQAASTQAAATTQSSDTKAASDTTAAATPSDPNVVHLLQTPDKDQQKDMRVHGKHWVVDETPGSRQLFFGPDGEFGWDDFLDIINPLQHIPIIAQIYRALTGDQMYGAAELIGALPFGPLGAIGLGGAIADLAVKDTTGKDIGENLEAALFGSGSGTSDPAAASAAAASRDADPAATGQSTDLASTSTPATDQAAAHEIADTTSAASQRHEDCRA